MHPKLSASLGVVFLLLIASQCRAQAPNILGATLSEPNAKTADISTEEMRRIVKDGSALVLDSRSRSEFDAGHIPEARLVEGPGPQVAAVQKMIDGDKARAIILYCNGPYCQASRRLGDELAGAGLTNVRRFQLGMPIWRAFGGPTAIEMEGVKRVLNVDRTAVFIDVRPAEAFRKGTLQGAHNSPGEEIKRGQAKLPLPEDDFNRRVIIFGETAEQGREIAESLRERPWHNLMYLNADLATTMEALRSN